MEIKNTQVYGLKESFVRSGYPMKTDNPPDNLSLYANEDSTIKKSANRVQKLANVKSGSGHDNFLKGIIVQFDLRYPQYFTPHLQRYHWINIVSSQSKMIKLTSVKNIKENCNEYVLPIIINVINKLIDIYNSFDFKLSGCMLNEKDDGISILIDNKKDCFNYIISNLPMGYQLWMGISTNYLQLKTIYHQRKNHKLEEWKYFCNWIESLPISELIINKNKNKYE